jgi:hypothetical protein
MPNHEANDKHARAHLRFAGANAAFRSTVNLTVLSVRASRDVAVRLTALQSSRQLADAPSTPLGRPSCVTS